VAPNHQNVFPIATQPTIASDGTVYYMAGDGLHAVSPSGKPKWVYHNFPTTTTPFDRCPAIGLDGTIYFADRSLWAINPDGTLKWNQNYADWLCAVCPTIGPDGTIYVTAIGETGPPTINAIEPTGGVRWSTIEVDPWLLTALDGKGKLYLLYDSFIDLEYWYVNAESDLQALSPSGAPASDFGVTIGLWFLVGRDGSVCYHQSSPNEIVFSGGGPNLGNDWDAFAMTSDDSVYGVSATGGDVRAYSNQGKLLWTVPGVASWLRTTGSTYSTNFMYGRQTFPLDRPLSVAGDGSIYVRSGNGFVVIN
jgi:hypothetical protein